MVWKLPCLKFLRPKNPQNIQIRLECNGDNGDEDDDGDKIKSFRLTEVANLDKLLFEWHDLHNKSGHGLSLTITKEIVLSVSLKDTLTLFRLVERD